MLLTSLVILFGDELDLADVNVIDAAPIDCALDSGDQIRTAQSQWLNQFAYAVQERREQNKTSFAESDDSTFQLIDDSWLQKADFETNNAIIAEDKISLNDSEICVGELF
jgi:hypothetical protein